MPVSSLNPYQYAFNSFTFGAGTNYGIELVDGLTSLPPLRTQDDNRGYIDGSYSGRDFYDARTVTMDFVIVGDSSHSAHYYYTIFQQNLAPQQLGYPSSLGLFQFKITAASGLDYMYGRVRALTAEMDPDFAYGKIVGTVTFFFPDPRYYDYPNTTVSGSSVSIANAGWATTCPVITISSAAVSFNITDGTTTMYFGGVTAGATIVIDTLQRTITQNGTANRSLFVSGFTWLSVPAATTSTWTISTGTMSVVYSGAYV